MISSLASSHFRSHFKEFTSENSFFFLHEMNEHEHHGAKIQTLLKLMNPT